MRHAIQVWFLVLLMVSAAVGADGPEDQYLHIYSLIQDADTLNESGRTKEAMTRYGEAQAALAKFPTLYPGWNENLIRYRLGYVNGKMAPLLALQAGTTNAPPSSPPAAAPAALPLPGAEANSLTRQYQDEISRLRAENANLAAKLKEALSVQPATTDARAVSQVEEKNKSLQKEVDLLKVTLSQQEASAAKPVEPAGTAKANRALAKANTRIEAQSQALAALRSENEALKKLAAGKPEKQPKAEARMARDLQQSRDNLAALQTRYDKLLTEKSALESRLKAGLPDDARAEAQKRKELEDQVADLRAKLAKAEKQLAKRPPGKAETRELQRRVEALQARLQVLEAKPEPYTAEELALLKSPGPQLMVSTSQPAPGASPTNTTSTTTAEAKPARPKRTPIQLPPGTGALDAAAQAAFRARRFDDAEKKYLDILRQDEKNVYVLGNLASTEIELNKLDDADKHLVTALQNEPEDDYCLYLKGRISYKRGKLDEALNLLSHAAQANPESAETQNHLGLVLADKGLRAQAEAAFRRAIQLQPGYAQAHSNLALVYATQKPPSLALARWHYQKALAAGMPSNREMEKLLGQ